MRSAISSSALFAALLALAVCACEASDPVPAATPSILLVTLDTLRRDHVGVYQTGQSLTPYIDALAAEGLIHDHAYTTMPTTGPAHLSLFTGLYPSEHGGTRNGQALAADLLERELAARLRERGYATAAFVTAAVASRRAIGLAGFEVYDGPRRYRRSGEDAVAAALAWLDAEKRRPVFVWVHLYDVHSPYGGRDRAGTGVDPDLYGWVDPGRYASEAERTAMAERYRQGVRELDGAVRNVVSGFRHRLDPRPLVVLVGDHGESLDEHLFDRRYAYDHGEFLDGETVAIPLIVVGPGTRPGRSRGAVSIRDLYTTLLAAGGIQDPQPDGRRDLREASSERRIVAVERRSFGAQPPPLVRSHAAAASDGDSLVIVDEAGEVTQGDDAGDLAAVARLRAQQTSTAIPSKPLDAPTRDALRALGYAE